MDQQLGGPGDWPSPLIAYRLASDFQEDWKVEVGQWLKAAEQYGFLDRVLHDIGHGAKRRSKKHNGAIDPNDPKHLKLHQHLATARLVHYLTATGWGFVSIESETGGSVDIDCTLVAPNGETVEFQVKAPDQPGVVEDHRRRDGEDHGKVIEAMNNAATQLRRPPTAPSFVVVCANRDYPISWDPGELSAHLYGPAKMVGRRCYVVRSEAGSFTSGAWDHVSGAVLLDLARPHDGTRYECCVFLNPDAAFPGDPSWFPHARVCAMAGDEFTWVRGEPWTRHLPTGTRLVEAIPDEAWEEALRGS